MRFDLVLRNGRVFDGSGAAPVSTDLAILGDRIAAIDRISAGEGEVEIDVGGQAISPGFIDVHTHDDRALLVNPEMAAKTSQGVTTVITGNCGISLAPLEFSGELPPPLDLIGDAKSYRFGRFGSYLDARDSAPAAVNAACLVGHSTLRVGAMAALDRPANDEELAEMCGGLSAALEDGAIGLSSGTFYPPAAAAPTSEITALAELVGEVGGIYTTHIRDETDHVIESLQESFSIAREASVPLVISHHKVAGKANHGRSRQTLPLIADAIARLPAGLDAYPYVAASSILDARRFGTAERVVIAWSQSVPEAAGRDLAEIIAEWGVSAEAAVDRLNPAGAIYFLMDEQDVRRILAFPYTMIGSDGLPHDRHPHPRLWGTFPRVLGHYAREEGLFPIEEAIRRMTTLPAARFGLVDRGTLALGALADIVVFDPDTIIDRATFDDPTLPAAGIDIVLVNGRTVWRDGAPTGARPGRALRRQQLKKGRSQP